VLGLLVGIDVGLAVTGMISCVTPELDTPVVDNSKVIPWLAATSAAAPPNPPSPVSAAASASALASSAYALTVSSHASVEQVRICSIVNAASAGAACSTREFLLGTCAEFL
jgi:hypothetical protein